MGTKKVFKSKKSLNPFLKSDVQILIYNYLNSFQVDYFKPFIKL